SQSSSKPDDKKDAPASGGFGSRLGGLTGGITSRIGGGDDKKPDNKPGASKPAESGGIGAKLGGLTGGLTSRFGGGDKKPDEKKPNSPTTGTQQRPSSTSSPMSS